MLSPFSALLCVVVSAAPPPVKARVPPQVARAAVAVDLGDPDAFLRLTPRGTVAVAQGQLGFLRPGTAAVERFVADRAAVLGLLPREALRLVSDEEDVFGNRHVRLRRTLAGLPVLHDEVRLHAGADGLVHALEADVTDLGGMTYRAPAVSPWHAVNVARGGFVGTLDQDTSPTLVVLAMDGRARQVWQVRVGYSRGAGRVPFAADVMVDALTGEVVASLPRVYTGTPATMQSRDLGGTNVTLDVSIYSNGVVMENAATVVSNGDITTVDGSRDNSYFVTTSTSAPYSDATAVSVHDTLKRVYQQYDSTYGHRRWDFGQQPACAGGHILGVAHEGNRLNNAYFAPVASNGTTYGLMAFGDGDGSAFTPLVGCFDVAGHEMGHGVVEGSARLVYQYQSGALNEHFADVFGWLMDPQDDLIGEDCVGPDLRPALRDMCNPGNVPQPQPGHMRDYLDLPNTEEGDNGGVHANSGIPNRAACVARNGTSAQTVGRVWFQALTQHLGAQSTFADMVAATAASCGEVGASAAECAAIADAWVQVGLGSQASGGQCPANASLQNGSCFCNEGFRPNGDGTGCEAVANVNCPANSQEQDGSCYCNQGYVPDSSGEACVLERDTCPSNAHREGGTCVCDACYQGNPNGNGNGCDAVPGCVTCAGPLETGANGSCQCIAGISQVCGPTSLSYQVMVSGMPVTGEQCCRPDNPCGWANDGACDCFGECDFDTADCGGSGRVTEPICGARNAGNCGDEVWAGRCVGNTLIWCDDRTQPTTPFVSYVDCSTYMQGYVCGEDTVNGGFNCVQRQDNCDGVPSTGRCNGSVGSYCDNGVLKEVDCAGRGCGTFNYQGTDFEFCYPCPQNATYNASEDACYCNDGFTPAADGKTCEPTGSSSGGGSSGGTACQGGADAGCPDQDAESDCACARPGERLPLWSLLAMAVLLARHRRRT